MALLERFYDHTQGTTLLNGQDMRLFNVKSIRSKIDYVGQEPVLFALTIADTIRQGCQEASDADVGRSADAAQLDFIKALPQGLQTYVGAGGSQFSGSQKQRLAIARALVKKPSVLFFDETTSALDSRPEKMIQETIDAIGSAARTRRSWISSKPCRRGCRPTLAPVAPNSLEARSSALPSLGPL